MWQLPEKSRLYAATDATWGPKSSVSHHGWEIREGAGGGKRVSAATKNLPDARIEDAESAMDGLGQNHLFMLRDGEDQLDRELDARGYVVIDPVTLYAAPISKIQENAPTDLTSTPCAQRLAALEDIWQAGGIGTGRFAVMDRVAGPKTHLLGRCDNSPAAAAFVACDGNIAMLHALEVAEGFRKRGLGRALSRAAAAWGAGQGADTLALMTTDANTGANMLYQRLGMQVAGHYHYRVAPSERPVT